MRVRLTGADAQTFVCASRVEQAVDRGVWRLNSWQSNDRGVVGDSLQFDIPNHGISSFEHLQSAEETLVAEDVGVDARQKVESGGVLSSRDTGDIRYRGVGSKVSGELGKDRSDAEVSVGGIVGLFVDWDWGFTEETTVRFGRVRVDPESQYHHSLCYPLMF